MNNRIYRNGLPVWVIGLQSKLIAGNKIDLEVTAKTNEDATRKCVELLGDYEWLGTRPLYLGGKL